MRRNVSQIGDKLREKQFRWFRRPMSALVSMSDRIAVNAARITRGRPSEPLMEAIKKDRIVAKLIKELALSLA